MPDVTGPQSGVDKVWSRCGADRKGYIYLRPRPDPNDLNPEQSNFSYKYLSCLRHKVASQSRSKLITIYNTNLRNGCICHEEYSIICRVGHPRTSRLCRQRPLHSLLELFCEKLQTP